MFELFSIVAVVYAGGTLVRYIMNDDVHFIEALKWPREVVSWLNRKLY